MDLDKPIDTIIVTFNCFPGFIHLFHQLISCLKNKSFTPAEILFMGQLFQIFDDNGIRFNINNIFVF